MFARAVVVHAFGLLSGGEHGAPRGRVERRVRAAAEPLFVDSGPAQELAHGVDVRLGAVVAGAEHRQLGRLQAELRRQAALE